MKRRFDFILGFVLVFVSSFLFLNICKANTYFDFNLDNYNYLKSVKASYFNEHFNRFSNENLNAIKTYFDSNYQDDGERPYILFYASDVSNLDKFNLILIKFSSSFTSNSVVTSTGFSGFSLSNTSYYDVLEYYDFDFESNSIILSDNHDFTYSNLNLFNSYTWAFVFPIWTSRDITWNDLMPRYTGSNLKTAAFETIYYISDYDSFDEKYKSYYNYVPYEYNSYIYTILDLVGINTSKPSNIYTYVDYEVRYYFDNVLDSDKTTKGSGKVGDVINEFTDYSDDNYYLIESDYSMRLAKDSDNYLYIYFKSYKTYKIEYYFDDVLRDDYSEYKKGKVEDVITEFTDYSDNDYKLYGENYSFTICEDDNQNVFRIYYRSNRYGSGASYEQINTRNSKIPLIFHYDTIKELFTGINFNSFTQSEQLMITLFINIWFIGIFSFVAWLFLKIIYKVFSIF